MEGRAGSRGAIFWIQMLYVLILAIPVVWYVNDQHSVPTSLGPIPTAVPWFGALGAVMISLWGVTEHRDDWDAKWKYWHWSRPFVGATLAVIMVFILKAGLISVGQTPTPPDQVASNYFYPVVAFVIGYREGTFRDLIKKVADVILGPAPAPARPTIASLAPAAGTKAGGTDVTIAGTGSDSLTVLARPI